MENSEIKHLRRDYRQHELRRKDLDDDPFVQFISWLDAAIAADVIEPNAMALATATTQGIPSCRMVLMKHFDAKEGIVFFTNDHSRKAKELHENPVASAVFFWDRLERQVIMEGPITVVDQAEVETYFNTRPRGSQLGTIASRQDTPLHSRADLEETYNALEVKYQGKDIPCPKHWTGFRLMPNRFEFWQGRSDRLHDRFSYKKNGESFWTIERLSP